MSAQEFYEKMCKIADRNNSPNNDPEVEHIDADCLMAELLRQLGYGAGIDVFEDMLKWYA